MKKIIIKRSVNLGTWRWRNGEDNDCCCKLIIVAIAPRWNWISFRKSSAKEASFNLECTVLSTCVCRVFDTVLRIKFNRARTSRWKLNAAERYCLLHTNDTSTVVLRSVLCSVVPVVGTTLCTSRAYVLPVLRESAQHPSMVPQRSNASVGFQKRDRQIMNPCLS
jgi:hypothetical protein